LQQKVVPASSHAIVVSSRKLLGQVPPSSAHWPPMAQLFSCPHATGWMLKSKQLPQSQA